MIPQHNILWIWQSPFIPPNDIDKISSALEPFAEIDRVFNLWPWFVCLPRTTKSVDRSSMWPKFAGKQVSSVLRLGTNVIDSSQRFHSRSIQSNVIKLIISPLFNSLPFPPISCWSSVMNYIKPIWWIRGGTMKANDVSLVAPAAMIICRWQIWRWAWRLQVTTRPSLGPSLCSKLLRQCL